jgi:hypothetical protein
MANSNIAIAPIYFIGHVRSSVFVHRQSNGKPINQNVGKKPNAPLFWPLQLPAETDYLKDFGNVLSNRKSVCSGGLDRDCNIVFAYGNVAMV